METEGSFPC